LTRFVGNLQEFKECAIFYQVLSTLTNIVFINKLYVVICLCFWFMPIIKKQQNKNTKKLIKETDKKVGVLVPTIEDMVAAGVHFGHRVSRWNPQMAPYILGQKDNVHIIDLEKTQVKLRQALELLARVAEAGGKILFVGTKVANREVVKELAEQTGNFYVNERWLGGTITNFSIIIHRLKYLRDLEEKIKSGEMAKYTKKEQHDFNLEKQKLERRFGGIKTMDKLPEVVLVFDSRDNALALKEAKVKNITTIGLADTNVALDNIDYVIPGNDDAISAIKLIAEAVKKAIKK